MRRARTAALFAVAAASFGAAAASPASAATSSGCHSGWPVVAHHAGGAQIAVSAKPVPCVHQTGYASSESTIAVTPSGTLLYSPAHTENSLARSLDGGATWGLTYPQKEQYTALWNTVDPIVTVDRRTGRAFWLRATGDLRTAPVLVEESPLPWQASTAIAYAHGFQVYSSSDEGRNWTTADYQHEFTGDWEKIFVGPPRPASTGAPQPSGYPDVVYMCANAPFEVSGPGRDCYRSLDGGATFSLVGYVFPSASTPDICPPLAGGSGVVANDGTTYQPVTCENGAYLAISRDEGASYSWLPVKGAPPADGLGGGIQLAIDSADNLYALWLRNDQITLTISRDGGKSWSAPLSLAAPGVHKLALPALAAGPRGYVGVAYYGTSAADAAQLSAYVTTTRDALDPQPVFYSGPLNDPAHPVFQDEGFNGTPRADYVGGTYDAAGTFWAGVVAQLGPPDSNGVVPTTGLVGRLAFGRTR